jgi:hypothetical protein
VLDAEMGQLEIATSDRIDGTVVHASSHSFNCKAVVQDPAASTVSLHGLSKKCPSVYSRLRDAMHNAGVHGVKS